MLSRRALVLGLLALPILAPQVAIAAGGRLNPNTASAKQLAAVAGISSELASAITKLRPFATMVEFDAFLRTAMSKQAAAALYDRVFIPVNLNSASRDAIALIPGMSGRMVREFLEYRPYADIGVFNREIGKYVDAAEVARLRSYVTL